MRQLRYEMKEIPKITKVKLGQYEPTKIWI